MNKLFTKSASRLRIVLLAAMAVLIIVVVFIVLFSVRFLDAYASEVNETVIAADTSEARLTLLQTQLTQLDANQSAVKRAEKIAAESREYQYQDTIIQDIERFADQANLRVQSYDFASGTGAPNAAAARPSPSPAPTSGGSSTLKTASVAITLETPMNYRDFLQFLNLIEQNLTKMQVASVSLSSADSSSEIAAQALTLEVYIR